VVDPLVGRRPCGCTRAHATRVVVVTGGPGAGKTALLEVARRHYCEHVVVLREAASIVYGGGFPRLEPAAARRHAQIAIAHVQDEMERIEREAGHAALVLCDRGVLDGLAYWPADEASFLAELHATRSELLGRYDGVLHLRPPAASDGYDQTNPLRVESAAEAAAIDARIEQAYTGHPNRRFVESSGSFFTKLETAIAWLDPWVPECCRAAISTGAV